MRYAYLLLFTTFMFASCLDESPKSSLDDQQVYTSAKDVYLNTVANLYNYIGEMPTVRDYKAPTKACMTITPSLLTRL